MKGGLYGLVATIAFVFTLIYVTNVPAYVLTLRTGIYPYHFFIAGPAAWLFLALICGNLRKIPKANMVLVGWFLCLNILMVISLLLVSNIQASQDTFVNVAMFSLIAITFSLMATDKRILAWSGTAVAIGVCVLVAVSYAEFFNPNFNIIDDVMFESKGIEGRIQRVGGLYENPNANGYAMSLGMFIGQYFIARKFRFVFAILVGLAVLTTVSRSSMLVWTIITFFSFWTGAYSKQNILAKILAIALIVGLSAALVTGQIPNILSIVGLDSLMSRNMIERLSGNFLTQMDASTIARSDLIAENLDKFASNPIFGTGLGSSKSAAFDVQQGSHNMLLRMAVELGILGVLVYLSLLLVPWAVRSSHGVLFVIFYFIINLFTHTSYEKPIFAVLIAISTIYFSSAMLQPEKAKRRRRKRSRDQYYV